jgi:hypothetical protein
MPRFWLGRSVAGRLLIRNQRKGGGEQYPPKKDALVACGARPSRQRENFPKKKNQADSETPSLQSSMLGQAVSTITIEHQTRKT